MNETIYVNIKNDSIVQRTERVSGSLLQMKTLYL